ncbi:hypothetical protein Tco_0833556, partial [Tanacetum coccineum]
RDREQHSAHELFRYIEDNNEAAFSIATLDKIYAYELLNFNDTITGEVISKWKAGLNEDIDARSNVYVLNNGCKECSNDINDYYWEYAPNAMTALRMIVEVVFASYKADSESGMAIRPTPQKRNTLKQH